MITNQKVIVEIKLNKIIGRKNKKHSKSKFYLKQILIFFYIVFNLVIQPIFFYLQDAEFLTIFDKNLFINFNVSNPLKTP